MATTTSVHTKRPTAGTLVARSTTALDWAGPWVTIPGATGTISLPGGTSSKIDITSHDDVATTGRFRQSGAGLADVTDPSFNCLWDPDNVIHASILSDFSSGTVRDYRFSVPNILNKYGVRGQISIGNGSADINGYLTYQVTIVANLLNFNVG